MKRRAARILVFVLLGAIVSVAVAWGCAAIVRIEQGPGTERGWSKPFVHLGSQTEALIRKYEAIGTTRLSVGGWSNVGAKSGPPAETICPYWSDYAHAFESELMLGIHAHANGWPMRTLLYRYRISQAQNTVELRVDGGINLPDFASTGPLFGGTRFYVMRALPLRPIWPGFAINTMFYAAILWMLFAAPFALRRRRRIKRGLCPKCAYDLRGRPDTSACPECGAQWSSRPG